jgi:hypothetical protein
MIEDNFGNIIYCIHNFGECAMCYEQYRCVVYRKRCLNAVYGKDANIKEVKQL